MMLHATNLSRCRCPVTVAAWCARTEWRTGTCQGWTSGGALDQRRLLVHEWAWGCDSADCTGVAMASKSGRRNKILLIHKWQWADNRFSNNTDSF